MTKPKPKFFTEVNSFMVMFSSVRYKGGKCFGEKDNKKIKDFFCLFDLKRSSGWCHSIDYVFFAKPRENNFVYLHTLKKMWQWDSFILVHLCLGIFVLKLIIKRKQKKTSMQCVLCLWRLMVLGGDLPYPSILPRVSGRCRRWCMNKCPLMISLEVWNAQEGEENMQGYKRPPSYHPPEIVTRVRSHLQKLYLMCTFYLTNHSEADLILHFLPECLNYGPALHNN